MYYKVDEITKLELVEIDDDIPTEEYKPVSTDEVLTEAFNYIFNTGRYEAFLNYANFIVDTNEIYYKKRRIENGK